VINFFFFIAEEVRQWMAKLGFRKLDEMIGRVDMIEMQPAIEHWKAKGLDFSSILHNPQVPGRIGRRCTIKQDHGLQDALDNMLLEKAKPAIELGEKVEFYADIRNVHRAVGTMMSGQIARKYGSKGLPDDTIRIHFEGTAGQSFGAFICNGVTLLLEGDANDYVGKGLSGGKIAVFPPRESTFAPELNILVGNTVLYGATTGEAYFAGVAGERFAVRNSGATTVVEGVGDHACEYMTNGTVVVLGETGRNFGAGMSGGTAYVYDPEKVFREVRCNKDGLDLELLFEREDLGILESLIRRHVEFTGSPLGKRLLANWGETVKGFVKVIPQEYKRILEKRKAAGKSTTSSSTVQAKKDLAIAEAAH
jgi:glutamate synthase domain-containing protein 3